MKISEYFTLSSSSSKNDYFRTGQNSRVGITWGRRGSRDFGFGELIGINIQNVGII
jgi:hypothetical protein